MDKILSLDLSKLNSPEMDQVVLGIRELFDRIIISKTEDINYFSRNDEIYKPMIEVSIKQREELYVLYNNVEKFKNSLKN